jgi:hypothetical protein
MSRTTKDSHSNSDDARHSHAASLAADRTFTEESVRTLATAAGLALGPGREASLLPILQLWLADSATLNTVMQSEAYREVLPVTLFQHPRRGAGEK